MALTEPEIGKAADEIEGPVRYGPVDAFSLCAFYEVPSPLGQFLPGVFPRHYLSQEIPLACRKPGHEHGHLEYLFLIEDYPHGLLQNRLQGRVHVIDWLQALPPF